MTFWEFWMEKYQCQAQSTEETGKCCKNSEIIKGREILAMFLWLLFTAQESCDLCIAASSQQAAEPDHRPVMAPEMSSGVTGPHKDSKTDSFLQWGFPQEFLFWCHRLHQCLLIHITWKSSSVYMKLMACNFYSNFKYTVINVSSLHSWIIFE